MLPILVADKSCRPYLVCRVGVSRQVEKFGVDLNPLRQALKQPLPCGVSEHAGGWKCVIESVKHEHAFRLSRLGLQSQRKKEPNRPEHRDARPSHSRKGGRFKKMQYKVTNDEKKHARICRLSIYHAFAQRHALPEVNS